MRSKKKIIAATALIVGLITALSACNQAGSHTANHQSTAAQGTQSSTAALKSQVPAHFTEPPPLSSLAPTLSPVKFSGKVRDAYQVAKDIPQTLAQLPCFCHCDRSIGHKSLHSCYEETHATGCEICLDSALMAGELKQQGMSDTEIRDKLIAKYGDAQSGH